MDGVIQFLAQNSRLVTLVTVAVSIIVIAVPMMFIVAFFQGREITIWPPKIGAKDHNNKSRKLGNTIVHSQGTKLESTHKKDSNINPEKVFSFFKGWKSVEKEIAKRLEKSNEVRLIQIKGRELYQDFPLKQALKFRTQQDKSTKILLQDPRSKYIGNEVSKEFEWKNHEKYLQDFNHSLNNLADVIKNHTKVVKLYDAVPLIKLYIFDEDIFVSVYTGTIKDRNSDEVFVWFVLRKDNLFDLARLIERYFDMLWRESRELFLIRNNCVLFNENSYFLSIPVARQVIGVDKEKMLFRGKLFELKSEFHITIIGSNIMHIVKEILEKDKTKKERFLVFLSEFNWSYELTNRYYHLVRDITKGKKGEHIESIIQIVTVPGIEDFYKMLECLIDIQIPFRPMHITIYVNGNQKGISVDTQIDLETYNHGEITLDQIRS